MIKISMIRKYSAMLALNVLAAFLFEACAKEPITLEEPTGMITMTTKASEVSFHIGIKAGAENSSNLTINWGNGKESNITDAERYGGSGTFLFSCNYSGASEYRITITGDDIERLSCGNNQLTALDVSRSTALTYLSCGLNQLTDLDVSRNTALTELHCGGNQLAALDVSRNTALTILNCMINQLTTLGVGQNTELTILNCYSNQLTALDVSECIALITLEVCRNQITNLKVNAEAPLRAVCCENNQLTADALNDLFRALPVIPEGTWSSINYGGNPPNHNPGTFDCDRSIAEKKGWGFDQLHGGNAYD